MEELTKERLTEKQIQHILNEINYDRINFSDDPEYLSKCILHWEITWNMLFNCGLISDEQFEEHYDEIAK